MKKYIRYIILFAFVLSLTGCQTLKGATQDVANTARNIKDIFSAGKTVRDATK